MSLNFPKAEPVDLRAVYDVLSTAERLTAAIAGVVSPVPYEARELARMLRTADVRVDKRHLTVAAVEKACRALQRRGVLFGLRGSDHVVAAPLWAPWLTLEARQVDLLERLWAAFQADRSSYYWHFWEQQAQRDAAQLRYATVTGRFELVPDKTKPGSWTFLAQPGALGLLESLPERYRQMALRGCLDEAVNLAANPDPVIAACREHAHDLEPFAADIALLRVLQGRFDEVETIFEQLPEAGQAASGPASGAPRRAVWWRRCAATTMPRCGRSRKRSPSKRRAPGSEACFRSRCRSRCRCCPWCGSTLRRRATGSRRWSPPDSGSGSPSRSCRR